jgi:hypothetical protein
MVASIRSVAASNSAITTRRSSTPHILSHTRTGAQRRPWGTDAVGRDLGSMALLT